jgi:uncharacterized glyoxalase superfamily protein PhnB
MSDPTFVPAIFYRDPVAALEWLGRAFGFEKSMILTDESGNLAHAEMTFGNGRIMVGQEWSEATRSPASVGGKVTQSLHVSLDEDLDGHCERARAGGARIEAEPNDQFYGARVYRAFDPEGHMWTFTRFVRYVSQEEAERASGLKAEGWPAP